MTNLLFPAQKKAARTQYMIRLTVTGALLCSFVLLVVAVGGVPTLLRIAHERAQYESSHTDVVSAQESFQEARTKLARAQEIAAYVSTHTYSPAAAQLRALAQELAPAGVQITHISISLHTIPHAAKEKENEQTAAVPEMVVRGVASERAALTTYRDALLAAPAVTAADLPLESFAGESDLTFRIVLTLTSASTL